MLAGGFLGSSCAPYGPSWEDLGGLAQGVAYLLPKRPPFIEQPVRLSGEEFSPRPSDSLVEVIAADSLSRNGLQHILDEHVVIARFQVSGAHAKRQERASAFVRSLGGHVLLTTHSSPLIGVIFKDVHYAGPPDGEEAMYALRHRAHEPQFVLRCIIW